MQASVFEELIRSRDTLSRSIIKNITPVNGGCIHDAWRIKLSDGGKLFAKTTSLKNWKMLEFEANGLRALNQYANKSFLVVPQPIMVEKIQKHSVLIMPWIGFKEKIRVKLVTP